MAQNDLIKEIVFIADEQYEAPAFAWGVALSYLLAMVVAEVLTNFISPLVGIILYVLILVALLVQSSIGIKQRMHHFLVILSLVPLTRLLAMTTPMASLDPIYWYLLVGVLLSIAVFITARLTGFSISTIGLHITREELPIQLLIGLTGLGIGLIEYLILRPDPLITNFSWLQFLILTLVLLVFAGLLQEIIFRGLLQTSTMQILGRFGILYVALVFALQYLGFRSLPGMLFVLLVGLAFGVIVARTRSLVGVSLSHGLANISLFLVFPLLMAGTAAEVTSPEVMVVPVVTTPIRTARVSLTATSAPVETQPLVLIPVTGPTATSTAPSVLPPACNSHPNWVVYVSQPGETLESIGALYGISPAKLSTANCFEDDYQFEAGLGLFVPFDLIPSPTPSLAYIFPPLNTPTSTPTKKPTRKPTSTSTDKPVLEVSPTVSVPTSTSRPPSPTPWALPTLAPTQQPPPPPLPSPTPEN